MKWRAWKMLLCVAALSTSALADEPPATAKAPIYAADLKVKMIGPTVVGFPIVISLEIINKGEPFIYSITWGGDYAPARYFHVEVKDAAGKVRFIPLGNGQGEQGSFSRGVEIKTHATLPAAFDPLPAGKYEIRILASEIKATGKGGKTEVFWPKMESAVLQIEVKDDAGAVAKARDRMLAQMQDKQDPQVHFAEYVIKTFGLDPQLDAHLEQLEGSDINNAIKSPALYVRYLPEGADKKLKMAAVRQSDVRYEGKEENLRWNVLDKIVVLTCRLGATETALDTLIVITKADASWASDRAVYELAKFPQKRAAEKIAALAKDDKSPVQFAAVAALANQGDKAAIKFMIEKLKDAKWHMRYHAVEVLGQHRKEPDVKRALEEAAKDEQKEVRENVERAMKGELDPRPEQREQL